MDTVQLVQERFSSRLLIQPQIHNNKGMQWAMLHCFLDSSVCLVLEKNIKNKRKKEKIWVCRCIQFQIFFMAAMILLFIMEMRHPKPSKKISLARHQARGIRLHRSWFVHLNVIPGSIDIKKYCYG